MKYSQLRAFHAVATYGGYQAAAKNINIQQPTVSGHVSALEKTHGLKLFRREGRGVVMTPAGAELKLLADELFDVVDRIDGHLGEMEELARGSLRLAVDTAFLTGELIALFKAKFPALQIDVSIGNAEFVTRMVKTSACDLGIVAGTSDSSDFDYLHLASVPIVAVVPADHAFAMFKKVGLKDLALERLMVRERGSNTRRLFDEACHEAGVELQDAMEMERSEMILAGVTNNLGIGILEEVEVSTSDKFKSVPIRDINLFADEYLMWAINQTEVNIVRAFVDMAREWVSKS
jgi:LysR family transcriptional regulator, low CO2-responsive transcriptional regulator